MSMTPNTNFVDFGDTKLFRVIQETSQIGFGKYYFAKSQHFKIERFDKLVFPLFDNSKITLILKSWQFVEVTRRNFETLRQLSISEPLAFISACSPLFKHFGAPPHSRVPQVPPCPPRGGWCRGGSRYVEG